MRYKNAYLVSSGIQGRVFTFGQEFDLVAVELQPTSYLAAALIKPATHSSSLVAHR